MTKLFLPNHSFIKKNYPEVYTTFRVVSIKHRDSPFLKGIKKSNPQLYERLINKPLTQ